MWNGYQGWESFTFFFSAEYAQSYLQKRYEKIGCNAADHRSYENCYPFLYYLEHGGIYYTQAALAPIVLQPILLFYGLVHLVKACILTEDPFYPETTAVLAHGVSARKRKKQQYQFFHDEVKFQKNGLFPHLSDKLFHMKQVEGDKVTMEALLRMIPELDSLFWQLEGQANFLPLIEKEGSWFVSGRALDSYHMTETRFRDFFFAQSGIALGEIKDGIAKLEEAPCPFIQNRLSFLKIDHYQRRFAMPLKKNHRSQFPELMAHYLLLYNLSMIARYETEWWGEAVKMMPNRDYPFIQSFLNITQEKSPFLIYSHLTAGLKGLGGL
ncbi:YaaC family protein [Bacillus sp. FJAT-27445]|uniref:YaaC family protein n=1 Tax=Bacillus sp. FJAT-27445 TaxID=1679166 RepID=UPI0007435CDA|nr:YaaC family protein [Bacillus sp. FJAT-27445]